MSYILIEIHLAYFYTYVKGRHLWPDLHASCLTADTGFGLETVALPLTDTSLASSRPQPPTVAGPAHTLARLVLLSCLTALLHNLVVLPGQCLELGLSQDSSNHQGLA